MTPYFYVIASDWSLCISYIRRITSWRAKSCGTNPDKYTSAIKDTTNRMSFSCFKYGTIQGCAFASYEVKTARFSATYITSCASSRIYKTALVTNSSFYSTSFTNSSCFARKIDRTKSYTNVGRTTTANIWYPSFWWFAQCIGVASWKDSLAWFVPTYRTTTPWWFSSHVISCSTKWRIESCPFEHKSKISNLDEANY